MFGTSRPAAPVSGSASGHGHCTGPSVMPPPAQRPAHLFTVDVEEYFQVSALEPFVPRERWPHLESRVERGVRRLLELLDRNGDRATFFVLGWVAERLPDLVRSLVSRGHEVASHGYSHKRIHELSPSELRDELRRSKQLLEDLTGEPVRGFRAPSFSLVPGTEWALDVLLEEGYGYDASLFPIRRRGYGYPGTLPDPHYIRRPGGRILEIPIPSTTTLGIPLPVAGGAYFRTLPYELTRNTFRRYSEEARIGTFYIHPWELDEDQPRFDVDLLTRLRHYSGLSKTGGRLERLLTEFRFTSVAGHFASCEGDREPDLQTVDLPR